VASVLSHHAQDLFPQRVVVLAGDDALAAATVHHLKLTAVLLSLLRPVRLLHRAVGIVRLPGLGLCRVQAVTVKDLRAVRMAEVLWRDELVRRVDLLRPAKATRVLRLVPALPLFRAVVARRVCLLHAQPAMRLTRALLLHLAPHDLLCLADQAYLPDRAPRPLDSSPAPVPGYPPRARRHELVVGHSLDFPL
jgi:hypothetical protein